MHRILTAVGLLLLAIPSLAETVRFHPPAPTSRTAISATISGLWGDGCPPLSGRVAVAGSRISVALTVSQTPCPILHIRAEEYRVTIFIGLLPAGMYSLEAFVPGTPFQSVAKATLTVREAEPALTVVPSVIFFNGGSVRIRSLGIGTCPPNVSPCTPPRVSVSFNGNLSRQVRIISAHEVEAEIPILAVNVVPPPNFSYDVVVTTDDGRRREAKAALFVAGPDGLYDPAAFERVLIPVIFSGPGAFGSQWTTDVTIENPAGDDVPMFRTPIQLLPCGNQAGCPLDVVPARKIATIRPQWPTGLFVHAARGNDLRYNVLIRDLSRQAEALGTEIPVVRENDWYEDHLNLLNVPSDPRFRVALRVYVEDDPAFFGSVPLRIFRMNTDTLIVDSHLSLDSAHNGQIPGTNWIADLSERFAIAAGTPLRIEVGGPTGGERFWAFASITNNTTQHVTVISPQ